MRPLAPAVFAALALAALVAASPASADTQFFLNGSVVAPPASFGPVPVTGSVGSSGLVSGSIDRGRFTGACSVSNPAGTGDIQTPQVDAPLTSNITATDVHVIASDPNYDPQGITVTMHMLLSGDLAIGGQYPFAASVGVRAYNANTDVNSTLTLDVNGLSGTALLAGAPAHMANYPLAFPLVFLASPSNTQFMFLGFSTRAAGTSSNLDNNSASAIFSGQGLRFPTATPAFDTPPGIVVNIPSLNIVNNYWIDPLAGVAAHPETSRLALSAVRNPVHGAANFALTLPADGAARLEVFDVSGRSVATLLDGWQAAGSREVTWNTGAAGAGVYFARLTNGGAHATARVVVTR